MRSTDEMSSGTTNELVVIGSSGGGAVVCGAGGGISGTQNLLEIVHARKFICGG
jgi:hypothetical protein